MRGNPNNRRFSLAFAVLLASSTLVACSDDSTSPTSVATTLSMVSGDNQSTTPNTALASPLVVQVNDQNGAALSSAVVTWALTNGSGALSATSVTTDSNGQASVTFTPDASVGTVTISATTGTLAAVTFTVTVAAGT